jgi:predicted ATPase
VNRRLGTFVRCERELEDLERGLKGARSKLRVIDLMAEPGMGKSRLVHEFRQSLRKEQAFVLSGSRSPESQQTSFFPLSSRWYVDRAGLVAATQKPTLRKSLRWRSLPSGCSPLETSVSCSVCSASKRRMAR